MIGKLKTDPKHKDSLEKLNNFVIFKTDKGKVNIDVFFTDDTLWLTQKLMAELFETTKQNVSQHLQNIFEEGELEENSVVKKFLTTASDGKTYETKFYNLDAIIAVEYYEKFRVEQDKNFESDFDREVEKYLKAGGDNE